MEDWCSIQLSYAIGVKEPTSIYVDSNGHNRSIEKFIRDNIDLTPKGIIDRFELFNFYSTADVKCTHLISYNPTSSRHLHSVLWYLIIILNNVIATKVLTTFN